MNKWMKQGLMGLAISAASVGAEQAVKKEVAPEKAQIQQGVMVDALDFAGGSKLKDRMVMASASQDLEIILVSNFA